MFFVVVTFTVILIDTPVCITGPISTLPTCGTGTTFLRPSPLEISQSTLIALNPLSSCIFTGLFLQ